MTAVLRTRIISTVLLAAGLTACSDAVDPWSEHPETGRWFSPEQMPERIPNRVSISRSLIDWFVTSHGGTVEGAFSP